MGLRRDIGGKDDGKPSVAAMAERLDADTYPCPACLSDQSLCGTRRLGSGPRDCLLNPANRIESAAGVRVPDFAGRVLRRREQSAPACTLKLIIVLSSLSGLALAVFTLAEMSFIANKLMFLTLLVVALPWGAYRLRIQVRWLCLGGEQPGHVKLWVVIALEWLVACLTVGTACAALAGDLFALQHDYCTSDAACVIRLVAAAGALAMVSALGMLWILGYQFRPAQAP